MGGSARAQEAARPPARQETDRDPDNERLAGNGTFTDGERGEGEEKRRRRKRGEGRRRNGIILELSSRHLFHERHRQRLKRGSQALVVQSSFYVIAISSRGCRVDPLTSLDLLTRI
ncbi:hypothetical protein THAOC_05473 [Thalassiosira oceanica]|uniref:Uncharacterized protein n=1 Tax=Thalassiosira oceanica TaxID=159749 RepID=K0T2Q9_THAOC|nr:hypothetical protein THAOC_05473 [Thalassiosira oceanica]|eukprot:EJK72943.1 hypothetical protein THAOC_05473 [Thalassiosira oceanica]